MVLKRQLKIKIIAKNFQRSENVSFGGKEVPCPDLKIENPGDDSEVDTAIQEYIKRHAK